MGFIEVENLDKSFLAGDQYGIRDFFKNNVEYIKVLNNISFSVKEGEICGFLGKNGAGKSTLLRTLGGIYTYKGTILIKGNITSIFELGIFFNPEQTGEEYCRNYFFFVMKKYDKELVAQMIDDIYEFTELEDYFYRPIRTYSSGMKAKLLFATATALKAEIVLIDEALTVGDAYFQGKAIRRVREMIQKGTAGVMVSHDYQALLRFCTKACILDKGEIIFNGEIRDAIREYIPFEALHVDAIRICNKEELVRRVIEWSETGEFEFDIEVLRVPETKDLEVNLFIERFVSGVGWNVIYTNGAYFKVKSTGIYKINAYFPHLGLEEGDYNIGIHVFETHMYKKNSNTAAKAYDRMTWLEKNGIRVRIGKSPNKQAIMKRGLKWTSK